MDDLDGGVCGEEGKVERRRKGWWRLQGGEAEEGGRRPPLRTGFWLLIGRTLVRCGSAANYFGESVAGL